MPLNIPGSPFNHAVKASKFIREELRGLIKQRKIDIANEKTFTTKDILCHMLASTEIYGMDVTEPDIATTLLSLLIAGFDALSTTITFIMKYLAELPGVYEKVFQEQTSIAKSKAAGESLTWNDIQKMRYSWNVASEVLRLVPPLQGNFREALTDFTYAGFEIPKGWKLFWNAYSTHKNPKYFPDPDRFDPSRFEGDGYVPYTYIPVGGGPRMCPGMQYARAEILVFMYNVVRRFKWTNIHIDEKITFDPIPRPTRGLPVRLSLQ